MWKKYPLKISTWNPARWRRKNATSVFFRSMAFENVANRSENVQLSASNDTFEVRTRAKKWSRANQNQLRVLLHRRSLFSLWSKSTLNWFCFARDHFFLAPRLQSYRLKRSVNLFWSVGHVFECHRPEKHAGGILSASSGRIPCGYFKWIFFSHPIQYLPGENSNSADLH